MRNYLILTCTLVLTALASAAGPAIDATGIRVSAPLKSPELSGFGWDEGVAVRLQLSVTEGTIVDFDSDSTKVAELKDDKGTDLLAGADRGGFSGPVGMMADYSADRKLCAFEIKAKKAPAKGATSVAVKGEAAAAIATTSKEFTIDNVALKAGTKFTLGDIPLEITKVAKSDWSEGTTVTFKTNRPITAIAEISFMGADGKKLEVSKGSSSTMRLAGAVTIEQEYDFKTLPANTKIVAKVWTDLKTVKIPFDLKVGLGL